MTVARTSPIATLLENGEVLVIGGCGCVAAELYNPIAGKFAQTGSMAVARMDGSTATRLPDGRVLVAGGEDQSSTLLSSAEIYDPTTGLFSSTGSMTVARWGHTATLLPNGQVLIAGGQNSAGTLSSTELFDPTDGTFYVAASMTTRRAGQTATSLPDGRVLLVGGDPTCVNGHPIASAEIYDPKTGKFKATGSPITARVAQTAIALANGSVLLLGGNASCTQEEPLASAELFDPKTATFVRTGSMSVTRDTQSAARLADGRVLVAGGDDSSAELYDPTSGTFSGTGSTLSPFDSASATTLQNGNVLFAGGAQDASGNLLAAAELFQP
jgi:WD40 repeat protein